MFDGALPSATDEEIASAVKDGEWIGKFRSSDRPDAWEYVHYNGRVYVVPTDTYRRLMRRTTSPA